MKNTLKDYQVEVYNFDNEVEVIYITAHNAEEAAEEAQSYVDYDIYNCCVYLAS